MIFDAIRRWMGGKPRDEGDGEMISCEEALSRIYEFLDGELDEMTHEEVERHFRVCTRCYPHLRLEQSFREALHRAVEGEEAPPELKERVLEIMGDDEGPR